MCCTETITRILVFVANFAFLLVGGALLAIGILYTVHFVHYTDAIPQEYQAIQYVPTLAIVVGSVIFFIAFLGCCGTLKSNTCMLTTYAAILFLIFLVQVGLGVFALIQIKDDADLKKQINSQITSLFGKYNRTVDITGVVDLIQQNLECCGTTSFESWPSSGFSIPSSCRDQDKELFETGCSEAMFDFITSSLKIIGLVALAISVTEVVGAILALCLSNCIRANERKGAYY